MLQLDAEKAGQVVKNAAWQNVTLMEITYLNGIPNSITQETKKGGIVNRNYYGKDGVQTKQISNDSHGEDIEYGNNREHAHDYVYNEDGELKSRHKRALTDEERKENDDIL